MMPFGSMPQCERNRRSSIARKALVTFLGSFAASTGAPMIAPRLAIGEPSSASRVMLGGVSGLSDCDRGAVTASQPTASTNRMMRMPMPRVNQRQ